MQYRAVSLPRMPCAAAGLKRCLFLLIFLGAAPAAGHQSSIVYSDIVVQGEEVDYTFQISSRDLYESVGIESDRPVSRDEVERGLERLGRYLVERVHITSAGAACPGEPGALEFRDKADGFFAVVHVTYRCPHRITEALVRYDLFFELDPRHQGIARLSFGGAGEGGDEREAVFRADARTVTLRRDLTLLDHVRDYLLLGVEHIFTGYDHLSFLFGLLVIAAAGGLRCGARQVLQVVTAFTVAHSLTLIASALGWVALRPRLVEPAIALSIAYVGVENLIRPAPRHRWLLTFGFGLVHGFGFASVLREIGLPHEGLVWSLLSFNLGVELGQLTVVVAILPLLALLASQGAPRAVGLALGGGSLGMFVLLGRFGVSPLPLGVLCFGAAPLLVLAARRYGYDRIVRVGCSALLTVLASLWFVERVLDRSFFGGYLG